jgi:hypothetical protein
MHQQLCLDHLAHRDDLHHQDLKVYLRNHHLHHLVHQDALFEIYMVTNRQDHQDDLRHLVHQDDLRHLVHQDDLHHQDRLVVVSLQNLDELPLDVDLP